MRRLAFLLGVIVIVGLFVSPAYAGGKVGVDSKKGTVTKSVALPKVAVAKVSLAQAVRAYFATQIESWFVKSEVKEPTKPSVPQKDWGYRPGVEKEYIIIRDHGSDSKDI